MQRKKKKKEIKESLKHPLLNIFIYLFYYFSLIQILGFTNPTPLKEISFSRLIRKGMSWDWFAIYVLICNWF
jgi:hypothetical protein